MSNGLEQKQGFSRTSTLQLPSENIFLSVLCPKQILQVVVTFPKASVTIDARATFEFLPVHICKGGFFIIVQMWI